MNIIEKKLEELTPYENNPRNNEAAVDAVAASIREFGFKVPIIIDKNSVIVAGHTRLKAAEKLGLKTVPVILADDLTEEQVRAFRLADNKTAEIADWDLSKLEAELEALKGIDMNRFGFEELEQALNEWFERKNRNDDSRQEENDEYNEFLDKFEAKKTTDDCYTPDQVYEAVATYVCEKYGAKREKFIRPFYPGGDYQREKYPAGCIVVDNPPFSILSEILSFYGDREIKYFLFAPTLTLFSSAASRNTCALPCGVGVTYENGACVNTSFVTNLEDENLRVKTCPELYQRVKEADDEVRSQMKKELPKYSYPDYVITSAMVAKWSKYGIEFEVTRSETEPIDALDEQKEQGKAIFGKGFLLSERAAAERAAAERAAAERAAAERAAAERWSLSEREKQIVKELSK